MGIMPIRKKTTKNSKRTTYLSYIHYFTLFHAYVRKGCENENQYVMYLSKMWRQLLTDHYEWDVSDCYCIPQDALEFWTIFFILIFFPFPFWFLYLNFYAHHFSKRTILKRAKRNATVEKKILKRTSSFSKRWNKMKQRLNCDELMNTTLFNGMEYDW